MTPLKRSEQETLIRWSPGGRASLYTASPAMAKKWRRLGVGLSVAGRGPDGTPLSWSGTVERAAIRFRRVDGAGQVIKRHPGDPARFRKAISTSVTSSKLQETEDNFPAEYPDSPTAAAPVLGHPGAVHAISAKSLAKERARARYAASRAGRHKH